MISAITLGEIEYGLQVARIDTLKQEDYRAFISTNLPMVLDITKRPESIMVCSELAYLRRIRPMQDAVEDFGLNN